MDFTEIAMQKLSQTAPELVNLIVAFRDISEEASAEEDISVGAFVLQSGGESFFIPVIKKDYTTYPIDSIFFCSEGKFKPLSKSTVTQILNASRLEPGRKTRIPSSVSRNPSVYDLVNPPRTGKFVYASNSRLIEFLASLPGVLKKSLRDNLATDSELANKIHSLYGIEDVASALKEDRIENKISVQAPAKAILTYGDALDEAQAKEVMEKGYAINESFPFASRVAIPQEEFEYHGQLHEISPSAEQGKCFRLLTSNGTITNAYVLKDSLPAPSKMGTGKGPYATHKAPLHRHGIVLTESGRILPIGRFIAVGDELVGTQNNNSVVKEILSKFTSFRPLKSCQDVFNGTYVVVLTPDFCNIVAGEVLEVVHSSRETSIRVRSVDGETRVAFIKGLKSVVTDASGVVSVPFDYPVLCNPFGSIDYQEAQKCEQINVTQAQSILASQALVSLGDRLTIGHDGIDYSINGSIIGPAHRTLEILVVNEGIDPHRAESFVKTASERKHLTVYMSKKADFSPGEIPEFGEKPQPQEQISLEGAKINQAIDSGDKQIADAMVISELLQSPDLFGMIAEYLPDISEAVDRLGRVLFLSRVRMDQLVQTSGSEAAMSTIASIKAVYRNLGDNLVKLEQLISNVKAG